MNKICVHYNCNAYLLPGIFHSCKFYSVAYSTSHVGLDHILGLQAPLNIQFFIFLLSISVCLISDFESPHSCIFCSTASGSGFFRVSSGFTNYLFYLHSTKVGAFKMSRRLILSIVSCLLLFLQLNTDAKIAEESDRIPSTAYDELQRKGFPSGLLPNSVANYSLNTSSGDFSVHLQERCDITLPPDNYPASFSKKITGRLTEGYIQGLSGISVRVFFKWWSITGIRSSGKDLVFEVGVASAKYPSSNFDESPDCEGSNHLSS